MPEIIWRPTWPDEPDDYTATVDGRAIGRAYRNPALSGQWLYFPWWDGAKIRQGVATSRREALAALEEAYRSDKEARE